MYKNYFFLNRIILEANQVLNGYSITNCFSQDKDKIVFELKNKSDLKFLEISVNPGMPYITIKNDFHRAKKNTVDFFINYLPADKIQFNISDSDRIIKIKTSNCDFYFTIRGKFTNLFLLNNDRIQSSFKNIIEDSQEQLIKEFHSTNFINEFNILKINIDANEQFEPQIKSKYPFVGKEILNEVKFRFESLQNKNGITSDKNNINILEEIILEIKDENPVVFTDDIQNQQKLAFNNFKSIQFSHKEIFENAFDAINFYLSKGFYIDAKLNAKKKIEKHLLNEFGKVTSKLNNLKARIEKGSKEEEYKKLGNLLLINLNSIKGGKNEVTVEDIYENNLPIKIKLDEKFSPKKNADIYFDKSKNQRISLEKSKQLFMDYKIKFEMLKEIENKFLSEEGLENYRSIMKELKIKEEYSSSNKEELQNKFKRYLLENKYYIFVGKDSKNNDLLTTKFAKQNDFWFHARSVPGSHVVLRIDNTKDAVPKSILKKTASLAAYHSKAKTSGMVPVSYTQKKYVVKKKGIEPGKVALLKEQVLIVKPEIPSDCEYISNE